MANDCRNKRKRERELTSKERVVKSYTEANPAVFFMKGNLSEEKREYRELIEEGRRGRGGRRGRKRKRRSTRVGNGGRRRGMECMDPIKKFTSKKIKRKKLHFHQMKRPLGLRKSRKSIRK